MIMINTIPALSYSTPDARDFIFADVVPIKAMVDLRPLANQEGIENQLQIGSCTANAIVSAFEILDDKPINYSRLFNYYTSRELSGRQTSDSGSTIRDAVQAAYKFGIPSESAWTYDPALVNTNPAPIAYMDAKRNTAIKYELLWEIGTQIMGDEKEERIKNALSEGLPVIFAAAIGNGWQSLKGSLDSQNYKYSFETYIGNHAMLFVGYTSNYLITENSWGEMWGDAGYGAFPMSGLNQVYEAWIIREIGLDDIAIFLDDMTEDEYQILVKDAKANPRWAEFFRYAERIGKTKVDVLTFCKTMKFEKLSTLQRWINNNQ